MGLSVTGGLTFGPKPVAIIRIRLVLVNLNPINDTYISKPFNVRGSNLERFKGHMQERARERMNPSPEACYMIEGWDPKHLWKRVCMQAAHEAHLAVADPSQKYVIHDTFACSNIVVNKN